MIEFVLNTTHYITHDLDRTSCFSIEFLRKTFDFSRVTIIDIP